MSLVAVLTVIFGLKQTAQDGPGPLPSIAIVAGLAVGVLFVRRQRRLAEPMIDLALFRIRAFNAALATNFLAIFVAVGYFLFEAQFLQLVLGLSPLVAGLWTLPSAFGFIVGSQLGPRIVRRFRAASVVAAGLVVSAVGLALLTQVSASGGLAVVVVSSVIISVGLAPILGLTTELIVGSAPPERAGAASGISETGAELGGALGIAILGTLGIAIYRSRVVDALPRELPADVAAVARDTLGAAVAVAERLPDQLRFAVLDVARGAFVHGMQLTSAIACLGALAVAGLALVTLRDVPTGSERETAEAPHFRLDHDIAPATGGQAT